MIATKESIETGHGHHHVLSVRSLLFTFLALLALTVITVWTSRFDFSGLNRFFHPLDVDLGPLNIVIAMGIATLKTALVAAFFMGLRHDKPFTVVVFLSGFVFLAIFIVYTLNDTLYRGKVEPAGAERLPFESPVKTGPAGAGNDGH